MTAHVRPAGPADARGIAAVRIRGWRTAYRGLVADEALASLDLDDDVERYRAYLERPPAGGSRTFVAVDAADRVLAFTTFGPEREGEDGRGDGRDRGGRGEIYAIYVDPDAWGGGVGATVLARAESELAGTWRSAVLWTLAGNDRARAFYERRGWRHDGGRHERELYGHHATEVRYVKELATAAG